MSEYQPSLVTVPGLPQAVALTYYRHEHHGHQGGRVLRSDERYSAHFEDGSALDPRQMLRLKVFLRTQQ